MRRSLYLAALSVAAVLVLAPAAAWAQSGDLDCSHFATQEAPQAILEAHPSGLDVYGLDPEGDGVACEGLGGGALEDGTAASVQQYQAAAAGPQQASSGLAQIPATGGPSLVVPAALGAALVVGCGVLGLAALSRRRDARGGAGYLDAMGGGER